jgi:hypothetical protein
MIEFLMMSDCMAFLFFLVTTTGEEKDSEGLAFLRASRLT